MTVTSLFKHPIKLYKLIDVIISLFSTHSAGEPCYRGHHWGMKIFRGFPHYRDGFILQEHIYNIKGGYKLDLRKMNKLPRPLQNTLEGKSAMAKIQLVS